MLKEKGWEEYEEKYSDGTSSLWIKHGNVHAGTGDFETAQRLSTSFEGIPVVDWQSVKRVGDDYGRNAQLEVA
jgi:hypothetical protein